MPTSSCATRRASPARRLCGAAEIRLGREQPPSPSLIGPARGSPLPEVARERLGDRDVAGIEQLRGAQRRAGAAAVALREVQLGAQVAHRCEQRSRRQHGVGDLARLAVIAARGAHAAQPGCELRGQVGAGGRS